MVERPAPGQVTPGPPPTFDVPDASGGRFGASPTKAPVQTTTALPPTELLRHRLFLAFVAVLPLHTVFFRAWVAWKPWLVLLILLASIHALEGIRARVWPWHRRASVGLAVFLGCLAVSWPGTNMGRFAALWLAAGVGGAVMLVTHRELTRSPGMVDRALRVVFWSAAAMGISGFVVSLAAIGTLGTGAIDAIEAIPGVATVAKEAYLADGFVALTNWHTDPGYSAAWMNLWAVLAIVAWVRGLGTQRSWIDGAVVGSLVVAVFMTLSRTGTLGLIVGMALASWFALRQGKSWRTVGLFVASVLVWAGALLCVLWIADVPGEGGDLPASFSFRFTQGVTLGPGFTGDEGTGLPGDHRSIVWPIYVDYFRDDPLRGAGLGHGWASGVQEPHNLVLQLLGETGVVGLLGFLVLGATIVWGGVSPLGIIVLGTTLSASMTQTVIFEATWWFAAALALTERHLAASRPEIS